VIVWVLTFLVKKSLVVGTTMNDLAEKYKLAEKYFNEITIFGDPF
jgi:hypothetical protein